MNLNSLGQPYQEVFRFPHQLKDVKKPRLFRSVPGQLSYSCLGFRQTRKSPPGYLLSVLGENTEEEKRGG